ncbi:hypothetical protein ACGF7W_25365 [Streptomyces sp. NPDC048219]|uniref:hypothetical protein n=1 Tax=Streptomyces sp. NPDC048219 TaxID=3365517 RepID=UPI003710A663
MTTAQPTSPRVPDPDPHRLLHRLVTALLTLGFLGYVLHQHPALRETAAAVGGMGALILAAVLAAGRSR